MSGQSEKLIDVRGLSITFRGRDQGVVEAVRGIDFSIGAGKTVAVVGESGSGKSVTALSLTRLLPGAPACEIQGEIKLDGKDILGMNPQQLRAIRGKDIAYVFQEPSTSLNPVFTVGQQVAEAVRLHRPDVKDVESHVVKAFDEVGIREPDKRYRAYPHELSGGMQQRVMIAMGLACEPRLLVADEPTTALDVTIQKQIMDLFGRIRKERSMSILLITHNFGIVKDFADEVIVMFRGRIVESGPTETVLEAPKHPYTQALIACIPRLGKRVDRLTTIDYEKIEAAEA